MFESWDARYSYVTLRVDMLRLEQDLRAGAVSTSDMNNLFSIVSKTVKKPKMLMVQYFSV